MFVIASHKDDNGEWVYSYRTVGNPFATNRLIELWQNAQDEANTPTQSKDDDEGDKWKKGK